MVSHSLSDDSHAVSPDVILWTNFRKGDERALALLYKEHLASLRNHGMSVCKDPELVNDCIHELFSRLWTQRERIAEAHHVKGYLNTSLERILVAQLLRQRKQSSDPAVLETLSSESLEQLWIDGEVRKERLAEIKKCLKSLPKCQREVIMLKFFNDLKYSEISEITGIQVPSVYNLISKALDQLREMMQTQPSFASESPQLR